ncbi:hypothetical protein Holit_03078 [Hollandina sp. SP2]
MPGDVQERAYFPDSPRMAGGSPASVEGQYH